MTGEIDLKQQPGKPASEDTGVSVMNEIIKRRTEHIARVPQEEDTGDQLFLLVLRLGRELYGIQAQYVFDIRPIADITPVPRVPDWVVGVANMRGKIISVIDLRRFFHLPAAPAPVGANEAEQGHVEKFQVLVETDGIESTLLVDDVLSVESFPVSRIENYNEILGDMRPEYIRGVIQHQQKGTETRSILIVLNLPALLGDKRLVIEEQII